MAKVAERKEKARYRSSKTLDRLVGGGFAIAPADLARFKYDTKDLAIALAYAQGFTEPEEIATFADRYGCDLTPEDVVFRIRSPVRKAWIAEQLLELFPHLCGFVYARLFDEARRGDNRAAKLFLERFDPSFKPTTRTESVTAQIKIDKLGDKDVTQMLLQKLRRLQGIDERQDGPPLPLSEDDVRGPEDPRPTDEGESPPVGPDRADPT